MLPEVSLPCSQNTAIELCRRPIQSNNLVSCFCVLSLDASPHLRIDLPYVSCLEGFRPKLQLCLCGFRTQNLDAFLISLICATGLGNSCFYH